MIAMSIPKENRNIQHKLLKIFAFITIFFILFLLIVLPYRLYQRDIQEARQNARRYSEILKTGLLSTMIQTGNSKAIRSLISDYKELYNYEFRMIRSQHVEKQHGVVENEQATDDLVKLVLKSGKSRDDWINRNTFRYVSAFIADERCQECHEAVDGGTITPGDILGASEIIVDLSQKEADSIRLIIEIAILLLFSLTMMGWIFYMVIKKGLLERENYFDD